MAGVSANTSGSDTTDERGFSDNSQLATFRIGDELFGLCISNIREIVRYPEVTAVPRSPAYLSGLANMRGSVLPVVDARIRLGMAHGEITDSTRVLVIEHGASAVGPTGLIVDMVCGVISLESVEREAPPPLLGTSTGNELDVRYVKSVIKADHGRKIIMEIDADALCMTESSLGSERGGATGSTSNARQTKIEKAIHELQLVTFLVAREEYAFPIESVREVLRIGKITEVPDVAAYLLGILSIRNALLPVVDIRKLFGLPSLVESLSQDLDAVNAYAKHLQASFTQYLSRSAAWTPDSTQTAVRHWFDSLHTSSEVLGRQYQLLRLLFQKLLNIMLAAREEHGRSPHPGEAVDALIAESGALIEQINLRVMECKSVLAAEIQEDQRILVIEIGRMPVGILVDKMQQVIRLPEDIIDQPPSLLHSENAATLKGIVKFNNGTRLVMLIDEERMLRCEELAELGNGLYTGGGDELSESHEENSDNSMQLVTFRLGEEEFGLSIAEVQEINRLDNITSVPRAPAFVEGVMNLRGNVIPAIDLRKRFGLPSVSHDESTRVIIVDMNGKLTGLIVDSVSEVFRLDRQAIETPPDVIRGDLNMDFIKGICKDAHDNTKMIVLIEVSRILANHEQELLRVSLEDVRPPERTAENPVRKGFAGVEEQKNRETPSHTIPEAAKPMPVPEASAPVVPEPQASPEIAAPVRAFSKKLPSPVHGENTPELVEMPSILEAVLEDVAETSAVKQPAESEETPRPGNGLKKKLKRAT